MPDENRYEDLIGENVRRRHANRKYRDLVKTKDEQIEDLKRMLKERDATIETLNSDMEAREAEFEETLSQVEESALLKRVTELETTIMKRDLSDKFAKAAGTEIAEGVDFDAFARVVGLNVDDIDPAAIDDKFFPELMGQAKTRAPYLFRPAQTADAESQATNGQRQDQASALRRLPTFAGRGSGGGAPPPGDSLMSTARLRDPADAVRRAREAASSRDEA